MSLTKNQELLIAKQLLEGVPESISQWAIENDLPYEETVQFFNKYKEKKSQALEKSLVKALELKGIGEITSFEKGGGEVGKLVPFDPVIKIEEIKGASEATALDILTKVQNNLNEIQRSSSISHLEKSALIEQYTKIITELNSSFALYQSGKEESKYGSININLANPVNSTEGSPI